MNWKILLCLFATLFVAACGGRSESITEVTADAAAALPCIPGEQVACACMGGTQGFQICRAGGQAFYPCECPEVTEDAGKDALTADAKTDAEIDAQTEAEADAQADADAGSDADADALAVETGVDAEADADAAEASVDAEAGVDADAEAGTKVILTVALATNPVSGTVVKKAFNADTVGITLTGGSKKVTVQSITLTGQAIIDQVCAFGQQCSREAFDKRVAALCLFDGSDQVGYCHIPDPSTGKALISNANLVIQPGETKILTVKATLTSTTATSQPFDRFAVGIAEPWEVQIIDENNQSVLGDVQDSIRNQAGSAPTIVQTVLPFGTFSVVEDSHPDSQIVVAGKDVWVPFARYKATAQYESAAIDRVRVIHSDGGDNADFTQVAIAYNGVVKQANIFQVGVTGGVDLNLIGNEIAVPKDGSVSFEVWAKIAPVVAMSVNPATNGVARSGHSPRIGLASNVTFGEWDVNFTNKLNVRTVGQVSGERIYAEIGAADGNPMVLRKVKPIVTKQNLANNVIFNGEMALYCWQVGVDSATSMDAMAYKQDMFNIVSSDGIQLCNFKLYRNSSIVTGAYSVTDAVSGSDLRASCKPGSQHVLTAALSFADQDAIYVGQSNIYCLRSIVLQTIPTGNSIATKFYSYSPSVNKTGQLMNNDDYAPYLAHPNIFNVGGPADPLTQLGAWHILGDMVWSDQSEPFHNTSVLGSKDWTNSNLVQDRSSSTVLSN